MNFVNIRVCLRDNINGHSTTNDNDIEAGAYIFLENGVINTFEEYPLARAVILVSIDDDLNVMITPVGGDIEFNRKQMRIPFTMTTL